jgi:hypothetical protein
MWVVSAGGKCWWWVVTVSAAVVRAVVEGEAALYAHHTQTMATHPRDDLTVAKRQKMQTQTTTLAEGWEVWVTEGWEVWGFTKLNVANSP